MIYSSQSSNIPLTCWKYSSQVCLGVGRSVCPAFQVEVLCLGSPQHIQPIQVSVLPHMWSVFFPVLSFTGFTGFPFLPASVRIISYSIFTSLFPAAFSASSVRSWIKFLLSVLACFFKWRLVCQYFASSSACSCWFWLWFILCFSCFLAVIKAQVSGVSHSLCSFFSLFPRTMEHVHFQVCQRFLSNPLHKPQWGTADAEIKNPTGGSQGLSKVPSF